MIKKLLPLLVLLLSNQVIHAQDNVLKNTNVSELKKLELELSKINEEKHARVVKYANDHRLLVDHYMPDGRVMSFVDIDADGKPVFKVTHNIKASATISTNKVYPSSNAASKFNLAGRGFNMGEWDGGTTRISHVEFQGRAIQADNGTMALSEHATHVAGTLVAGGVLTVSGTPNAVRGMAYQATLLTNDWNNDDAEMAARAAQGLLVSNHSYGIPCGWDRNDANQLTWYGNDNVNPNYDYKFGFYDNDARVWDRISFNAPHYLIVKSAGNSRDDGPGNDPVHPDNGPYDCIPTYSVAKNILTVGAVGPLPNGYTVPTGTNGVNMTSFSSWGPADDGRIKPDIVGDGFNVRSCGIASDNQTVVLSGTSMSGPSVAGSCLLLQEEYSNTHFRKKMLASTLKGLVIHTADEAWIYPGPDYRFGWGLMNTLKASNVIQQDSMNSKIMEEVLTNNSVKEYNVFAKGGEPLFATICWTDFEGTPGPAAYNSRLKMLVNDLDIRISGPGIIADSLPWRLNPDSTDQPARHKDNNVDNVEKLEIANPVQDGLYTIRVSHKGNLFTNATVPQQQNYSLIISGIIEGNQNRTCLPLQIVNSRSARFDDGSGSTKNYFDGANCKWLINPEDSNAIVRIVFKNFAVDPSDTLFLFNGTDGSGALIGKYTGSTLPDTVYSSSVRVFINFKSDAASTAGGWELEYNAIRKPKFDFIATAKTICAESSVTFTAQNQDTDTQGWAYSWDLPGAVVTNPIGLVVNPTYNTIGTFPVTLTVTNKYGIVTLTKQAFITVNPVLVQNLTPYLQGFESNQFPVDPTNPDLNWSSTPEANPWIRSTSSPFGGAASMRIKNNNGVKSVRELISPTFNIADVPPAQRGLSFMMAFARISTATATDQLRVLYSVDCKKTWTSLYVRSNTTTPKLSTIGDGPGNIEPGSFFPVSSDYRKDSVSFASVAGNPTNFTFKFEMTSDKGNYLYLDDVWINRSFVVGVEALINSPKLDMMLIPNPSGPVADLVVKSPKSKQVKLELFDAAGRSLIQSDIRNFDGQEVSNLSTQSIFGHLKPGIYLIRVHSDAELKTLKWIVN